jgi:hypothetical protein
VVGGAGHDTIGENVYPVTTAGKIIGGLIIVLGVATFALPTSILTSGFLDELQRRRDEKEAEERERLEEGLQRASWGS